MVMYHHQRFKLKGAEMKTIYTEIVISIILISVIFFYIDIKITNKEKLNYLQSKLDLIMRNTDVENNKNIVLKHFENGFDEAVNYLKSHYEKDVNWHSFKASKTWIMIDYLNTLNAIKLNTQKKQ